MRRRVTDGATAQPAHPHLPALRFRRRRHQRAAGRQRQPDRGLRLQGQPAAQHAPPASATTPPSPTGCSHGAATARRRNLRGQHPLRRAQPPHPVRRAAQQPGRAPNVNVIQPVFNEANLLERVDVWLERAAEPAALLDPTRGAVAGRRRQHRLRRQGPAPAHRLQERRQHVLRLRPADLPADPAAHEARAAAFTGDNPQPPHVAGWPGQCRCRTCTTPTTRPATSPTSRTTRSRPSIFRNQRVEPSNDYTYDALYRLIQADRPRAPGPGQRRADPPTRTTMRSTRSTRLDHPNDGNAMGTYIERYVYDAVGNFLQMQHRGSDPAHPGWTRAYDYVEPSLIEDGSGGHRARPATASPAPVGPERRQPPQSSPTSTTPTATWLRMPHLGGGAAGPNMHWDYKRPAARRPTSAAAASAVLRLRRRRPARAQGDRGEGARPRSRSASTSAASRSSASTAAPSARTQPRWSARRCT